MRRELLMPKLGLTMTEGTVTDWLVAPGAPFKAGAGIYIVESEKVAHEIEAQGDGVLLEVTLLAGELAPVGSVIGYWQAEGETQEPSTAPAPARRAQTPYARRRARELGVDLGAVTGSGPHGRVRAQDVEQTAAATTPRAQQVAGGRTAPAAPQATSAHTESGAQATVGNATTGTTLLRPSATQLTMARRLSLSKGEVPHFYLAREAEVGALLAMRAGYNASSPALRLTLNHLILAAVGRALEQMPEANRAWTDEGIVQFDRTDVGVAVDTERGLLVPVLRDAGRLPLAALAQQTSTLVDRARAGRMNADDIGGGAITVSNAGMLDVTYMTPIINPGQAMILGVGSVRDVFRPDAQGRPVARREMGLVLACDHRMLSGAPALRFLSAVVRLLENPQGLANP